MPKAIFEYVEGASIYVFTLTDDNYVYNEFDLTATDTFDIEVSINPAASGYHLNVSTECVIFQIKEAIAALDGFTLSSWVAYGGGTPTLPGGCS